MWARVHKLDKVRPQPDGSAIVLVEDERSVAAMNRQPALSTLFAVARVLNARRALELKFGGKGEVRYAANATLPSFLSEAVGRAGAAVTDATGDRVIIPVQPAAVSSIVDQAFAELAHQTRSAVGATDIAGALKKTEERRRKAPIDREANPALYWTAVFELMAFAGELSRARGGRWIDTRDMPVPYAIKLATGEQAFPGKLAAQIVEGSAPAETF